MQKRKMDKKESKRLRKIELREKELKSKSAKNLLWRVFSDNKRKYHTESLEGLAKSNSYHILPELSAPVNQLYYGIWKAYNGNGGYGRSWIERLKEIKSDVITVPLPKDPEDREFLISIYQNLKNFSEKGYLAIEIRENEGCRRLVKKTLEELSKLVDASKNIKPFLKNSYATA